MIRENSYDAKVWLPEGIYIYSFREPVQYLMADCQINHN